MSDVDLLYFKEKQLIIIMDKLNISTLNCEGLRRYKDYIRTYLDNNSCDILYKKHGILIIILIVLVPSMIIICTLLFPG